MAYNQTTSLQDIMDWCSTHTSLQNYFRVGGLDNQPALRIGNAMLQQLLARPMAWKFNRKTLDSSNGNFLVTQYGVQDIRFAGASAFILQTGSNGATSFGGAGIDMAFSPARAGNVAGVTVSGGIATAQTIDAHPFQVGQTVFHSGLLDSTFNSVFTFNASTKTCAWTNGFTILSVPDQFHYTFTAPANTAATVTNIAISNNTLTVTAANHYTAGQVTTFSGVGTNTFLNGQQVTILTAGTSSFTATFKHADVVSGADTGTVSICSGAPGFGTSDPLGNSIGLPAWGWGESASLQDINNTAFPQPLTCNLEMVRELPPQYLGGDQQPAICMLQDEGNGVLRFRMSQPGGDYNYQVNVVYQQRAPVMTSPQALFAWPDDMSYVLQEVGLVYAYRFAKGISVAESQAQLRIAQQAIQSAMAGEDRESNAFGEVPLRPLMR